MSGSATQSHRPGFLVVERRGLSILDLVDGEPRPVPVGELPTIWSAAELVAADDAALPPPVPAGEPSDVAAPDTDATFVVHEPVLLRLDHQRFLVWDDAGSRHVTLELEHLQLLDLLRRPRRLQDLRVDDAERRLAHLVALALVKPSGEESDEAIAERREHEEEVLRSAAEALAEVELAEADATSRADDVVPVAAADAIESSDVAESAEPTVDRLPPITADLPREPVELVRVLAYRVVGRTRRRLAARTARRSEAAPSTSIDARPAGDRVAVDRVAATPAVEPATPDAPTPDAPTPDVAQVDVASPDGADPGAAVETAVGEATDAARDDEVVTPAAAEVAPADTEPDAPTSSSDDAATAGLDPDAAAAPDTRVPVIPLYCWGTVSDDQGYGEMVEPSLSVGVLFAAARHHDDGRLLETYDLRRLRADAFAVLEEWAQDPVPAVFVFSDYLWNVEVHLELSERVKEVSPDSICLHGGPSVPKYAEDSARFFADNPSVDVAAHGEGEITFIEILEQLDGQLGPDATERLTGTPGITVRRRRPDGDDELVKTPDRERMADLNQFPSPYLSGEFDDLLEVEWRSASIETNRGCPYGCTYCDWGSATLSRIRKLDLDRVKAELDWIVTRAAPSELHVTDANFGIFARDVEIAEHVADLRRRLGSPYALTISLAKNTVKYSQRIIEILVDADVSPITASAAVQTMDPDTLIAIDRQNIKLEKYDELAVTFTEQGIPLVTDLLMGLPGATLESFKNDLQHCFDREVTPRTMEIIMLPNSPMNEPGYRERYALEVDEHDVLVASSTYTREDYRKMQQLRLLYRAADHFGLLRHVLRFVQWEHGVRAIDVLADLNDAVDEEPDRYPLLRLVARTFDLYTVPPVSWRAFYDELADFLEHRHGIAEASDLRAVLDLQEALMPTRGRSYPHEVHLEHDVAAYRADRAGSQRELAIRRPLRRYPPATVVVRDPGEIVDRNVKRNDYPGRRSATTGNLFWVGYDWELDSPFVRHLATNVGRFDREPV